SHASTHDGICAEIPGIGIGDMHGAALAFAIAGFFAQQFSEHPVECRSLRDTVAVAPMGAGDVVVGTERFAYANCDGFFTAVKMREEAIAVGVCEALRSDDY